MMIRALFVIFLIGVVDGHACAEFPSGVQKCVPFLSMIGCYNSDPCCAVRVSDDSDGYDCCMDVAYESCDLPPNAPKNCASLCVARLPLRTNDVH